MKKKILLFLFIMIMSIFCITNTYAYDKYDGEYNIEYLLRNYNVVTFGINNEHYLASQGDENVYRVYSWRSGSGDIDNIFDIGGPVLIEGDYKGSGTFENEYAQKTNGVSSYIKGKIDSYTRPGSIESAEISNIFLGSSNTLTTNSNGLPVVNGYEYKFNYPTYISDDYLNFEKLYSAIQLESEKLLKKGTLPKIMTIEDYHKYFEGRIISEFNIQAGLVYLIEEPGIYTVEDMEHEIWIANYDPNKLYIINYGGQFVKELKPIGTNPLSNHTSGAAVYCGRDDEEDTCTGNIIYNMPNVRYLEIVRAGIYGHIVAPNADVNIVETRYPYSFIVNSLSTTEGVHTAIQFNPYNIDESFSEECNTCTKIREDDSSDYYEGAYSIDELLKNYSVVTLGQKDYVENSILKNLTDVNGTVSIFHIAGKYYISGNLGVKSIEYQENRDRNFSSAYNLGMRLDHHYTNIDNFSYVNGNVVTNTYLPVYTSSIENIVAQNTDNNTFVNYVSSKNKYYKFPCPQNPNSTCISYKKFELDGKTYSYSTSFLNVYNAVRDNYINFKTLYNSIVAQQEKIDAGQTVTPDSQGNIHIQIGGNYTIEGIDEASKIIFDNFEDNKDKLTIVTINDSGSINMPFEASDTWNNVATNDYFGGNTSSPNGTVFSNPEVYYGNIVFNIPNATYIKLASGNSFKGHIIAPNADVETPEINFAGAMIVNSLYSEGYTEAHFYPLTVGSVGTGIEPSIDVGVCDIEKITISGKKIWDDKDDQDKKRPETITINLLADGVKIDSKTINLDETMEYEFSNLDRLKDGKKIKYTITEDAIDNYSTEIKEYPTGQENTIDGFDITNKYTPEQTSLTVNKVWIDEDDYDKIRPDSVEVELYANGKLIDTKEITSKDNWVYIFNELDMYSNGERIEYTVKEKTPKGYTNEISGNQEEGYTITNTHEVKKEVKNASNSPKTLDNVIKYVVIACVSLVLITLGIIIYIKKIIKSE